MMKFKAYNLLNNSKPGTFTRSVETHHKTVEEAEAHLETLEAKAPVIFIQWGLGD